MGNLLAQSKALWPNDGKHTELANSNVWDLEAMQGVPHVSIAKSLVQAEQLHWIRQRGLTGAEAVS